MKTFISTLMGILLWGAFPTSATEAGKKADCDTPAFPGAFECQVTVDQGWESKQQQAFWFTGQGSNIIPYSWFLNLEQANSAKLFRSPDNIDSYRYLPQGESDMNPDGLPIGFTKDDTLASRLYKKISKKWLGLTCAACHTGQLEYGGRKVLIDGAPTMADFQSFFEDMATAMRATYNSGKNGKKFKRFAAAIKKYNDEKSTGDFTDEDTLLEHLDKVTVILETRNVRNSGSIRFGNSRLDALGSILNQVDLAAGRDIKEGNVDAPVSYPFIGDTPQLDRVQWNGSVHNAGAGAPGRNIGEVIGVFGVLKPDYPIINGKPVPDHQSSVNIARLGELEELLWGLQSPRWEDVWKDNDELKIDKHLADFGERVYAKRCKFCHALPIKRSERESEIKATMVSIDYIGTDAEAAKKFMERSDSQTLLSKSVSGVLIHELQKDKLAMLKTMKAGQPNAVKEIITVLAKKHLKGDETGFSDNKRIMSATFIGALKTTINAREKIIQEKREQKQRQEMQKLKAKNYKKWEKLTANLEKEKCIPFLCYKARPLNGVWASAPYLHNGSVRTLRQLLVPSERQEEFNVGSREYDPKNMGFKDAGNFVMNTTLPGNRNTGHSPYGIYFEDHKRSLKALMEYLKSL